MFSPQPDHGPGIARGAPGILGDLQMRAATAPAVEAFRFLSDAALRGDAAPESWTWAEVRDRAAAVGRDLAGRGIGAGDRVMLAYPAGLDFIAAFLGCLWIGAVAVPVSPPRPRDRISRWDQIARDAEVAAILTDARLLETVRRGAGPDGVTLTLAAADPAVPLAAADNLAPADPGPEDLAFLQYTSGSTGAPKGVMVTHGMLTANLAQIAHAFRFTPQDRIAGWLPHYHDMGLIGGILTPVHLGIPNVMMSPAAFLRDPIRYLEIAGQVGATVLGGPDFSFAHCLRHATPEAVARVDLSRLRFAFSGAEVIRPDTLRRFARTFAPRGFDWRHWAGCYGLAEATLCVAVVPPGEGPQVMADKGVELVESGVPVEGLEVAIVGPDGARAPAGGEGEIWLRGPNVAHGYWRNPAASAVVFDQRLAGERGWLATGDLGLLRGGRLFVTGRRKELIVIRGQNHAPQDIEATVAAAHPAMLAGRVAAYPAEPGVDGGLAIACELDRAAVRRPDPEPVFAAIRAALSEAHGLLPSRIALLRPGHLPVTPSGKIQRFACQDGLEPLAEWRVAGPAAAPADSGPRGELAARLRALPAPLRRGRLLAHLTVALAETLGEPPAPDRRFFDLGLDSLGGVTLVAGLERALDLPLDATVIYEHATPAALTDHLLARLAPATAPKAEPAPAGARP